MKKLSAFIKEAGAASRLTDKYILAMLPIYPLFVGFWGYTRLTVSKSVFFAVLTLLWLMLTVAVSVKSRDAATSRAGNAPLRLILAYFALCCASALFSPYGASVLLGEGRFDGLLSLLLCAAVLFGTARFAEPKCAYLAASAASGVICCLIGIAQLFGFNPFDLFPSDYNFYDAGSRFSAIFIGTIGNADLFSAYLCLLLPISAAYYILAVKRPVWLLPVIAIFGFSLVECKVSAGLLAVCCTALIAPPLLITNGGRLCRALECFAVLCFAFCLASGFQGGRESGVIRVDFAPSVISAALLILAISSAIASLLLKKSDFPPKKLQVFFASLSFGLSPLKVANGLLKIEKRWEYGMTETLEAYDFSSTRRLLDKAKKSNVKLALFTNDSPSSTEAFLKTFGEDYFSFLIDSSSPHHKPSVKTIEDFSLFSGVKPSEMALISDSSRDLRMGRKGGVGKLIGILGTEKKERLERYTSFVFPDIESALKSLI